jgi:hypothetical protein
VTVAAPARRLAFPLLPDRETGSSWRTTQASQPATDATRSETGAVGHTGFERLFAPDGLSRADDTGMRATVQMPIKTRPPRPYPHATYHPSAELRLTDRNKKVLEDLLPFLRRQALWRSVPVSKVEIHGFVNPEDRSEELVVTQWVALSAQEALQYWDRLADALRAWSNRLPRHPLRLAFDQIGIEVRWEKHAGSV